MKNERDASWQHILDGFEEAAAVIGPEHSLSAANDAFCLLFGISKKQFALWSHAAFLESLKLDDRSMTLTRNGTGYQIVERLIDPATKHQLLILRHHPNRQDEILQTGAQMAEVMVHRLRSPLTGVRGFLEMVQHAKETAGWQSELGAMNNGLQEVASILDHLYELAAPMQPALTQVNYRQVLNTVLERFNVFDRRRVVIVSDASRFYWIADSNFLSRIFYELIKNALEHDREEPARVQIMLLNNGFEISNAGIMMEKGVVDRLFMPFFTTKARGLGLGLAQSRIYARAMNADIFLKSNAAVGGIVFRMHFNS